MSRQAFQRLTSVLAAVGCLCGTGGLLIARQDSPNQRFPLRLSTVESQTRSGADSVETGDSHETNAGEAIGSKNLFSAIERGETEAVKRLLRQSGREANRSRYGITSYQWARVHGQKEITDLLAAEGADPSLAMPPPQTVVDHILGEVAREKSPGASVLVAREGNILFKKSFGLADVGHRIPNTPNTKFRIGSITKQFTAAAILKLHEKGQLGLSDTLDKFRPEYPRGQEVTIDHLLTHTSGIPSYTSKASFMGTARLFTTAEQLIQSFQGDPFDFNPGAKFLYNNSGYFLLGSIIEKVSGKSYGEFLQQEFFDPLGMKNTGVHHWSDILENEAAGYSYENGAVRKAENWDMSRAGGAGALYSTVEDLHRWNEAVFGGEALRPATLDRAFQPARTGQDEANQEKPEGYGYGWAVSNLRGLREIAHGGGLHGFASFLARYPEKQFTVVLLANCQPPLPGLDPGKLCRQIAQIFLWQEMADREVPKISLQIKPETLAAYAGRYDYGMGILTVRHQDHRLFAQLGTQPEYEIHPKSESEFVWKVVEASITFIRGEDGKIVKAVHRQGGQTIQALRLAPVEEAVIDPAIYDAIAGRYDYGGGTALTVRRDGRRILAQLTGQPELEIFPKSETEYFWKIVNAQLTFVRDEEGRFTKALHHQGGRKIEAPRIP